MGLCRFLYNNLITSETMFTVSSLRTGTVHSAIKEGTGSAVLNTSGNFSGTIDLEYIVEIDSIAAGAEVGQATFGWSKGSGWEATGVTTSAVNILLDNGVNINWDSGAGADFVVGDKWYFKCVNLFNAGKLLDYNRDTRYRSATIDPLDTVLITIDLGSAQEIKALALFDHNMTTFATVTLRANSADAWGAPAFSEAIICYADKFLHYLSSPQTYRYWRLELTDTNNTDTYIQAGELFLGSYLELSKNFDFGADYPIAFVEDLAESPYGVERSRFYNRRDAFQIQFSFLPDADRVSLETMIDAIVSRSTGIKKPFWWNEDSASPTDTWLVNISGLRRQRAPATASRWHIGLSMRELARSVA